MSIAQNVEVNLRCIVFLGTCPTAGCGLHIALRHFGEGVQLLHQSQSLFLGKSPHFKRAEGLTDSLIKRIPFFYIVNKVAVSCDATDQAVYNVWFLYLLTSDEQMLAYASG